MVKILEQLKNSAAMMEFRMKNGNHWARLLAVWSKYSNALRDHGLL
jgi:hypothetical protein